jgi:hypothetical protein
MSIAYVNSGAVQNAASGTTTPFTTGWSPTPGNTLIVVAWHTGTGDLTCSDGEGTGNVYTADADLGFVGQLRIKVFRCTNWQGSGACTITINNGTNEECAIVVAEYSGLAASPVDATPVTAQGTAANPTAGAIQTIAQECLIIAAFGDVTGSNGTITGNASYNLRQSNAHGTDHFVGAMQDRIVVTPTNSADGFTFAAVDHWVAVQVSYKSPSGVGASNQATQTSTGASGESIALSGTSDQTVQQAQGFGKSVHTNQLSAGSLALEIPATVATNQATQASASAGAETIAATGASDQPAQLSTGGSTSVVATGASDQPAQSTNGILDASVVQTGGSAGKPRKQPRVVPLSPRFRLPDHVEPLPARVPLILGYGWTVQPAQEAFAQSALAMAATGASSQQEQQSEMSVTVIDSDLEIFVMLAAAA